MIRFVPYPIPRPSQLTEQRWLVPSLAFDRVLVAVTTHVLVQQCGFMSCSGGGLPGGQSDGARMDSFLSLPYLWWKCRRVMLHDCRDSSVSRHPRWGLPSELTSHSKIKSSGTILLLMSLLLNEEWRPRAVNSARRSPVGCKASYQTDCFLLPSSTWSSTFWRSGLPQVSGKICSQHTPCRPQSFQLKRNQSPLLCGVVPLDSLLQKLRHEGRRARLF